MRFPALLRVMTVKEVRTLLRERGQVIGLIIAVVFGMGMPMVMFGRLVPEFAGDPGPGSRSEPRVGVEAAGSAAVSGSEASRGERPDPLTLLSGGGDRLEPTAIKAVRWTMIGAASFGGFFVASALGAAMALGSFAAEKDENTLEVLLATPLSDQRLYLLKYLAVTIPCLAVTYAMVGVIGTFGVAWAASMTDGAWPAAFWAAFGLAAPAPLLVILILTGLQVCVSARADSLKGAGQLFGITFAVVVFAFMVLPLVLARVLPDETKRGVIEVFTRWLGKPFAVQYVTVMGLGVVVALAIYLVGLRLMNRERMLT